MVRVFVEFEPADDRDTLNETLAAMSALGPTFIRAQTRAEASVIVVSGSGPCLTADTAARTIAVRNFDMCQCEGGSCFDGLTLRQSFQLVIAHALAHWVGVDGHVGTAFGIIGRGNVLDGRGPMTRTASGFVELAVGNGVFRPTDADIAEYRRTHP
jgi:hypothetical protein